MVSIIDMHYSEKSLILNYVFLGNSVMSNTKKCCKHINGEPEEKEKLFKTEEFLPYHPTQEPIFPPELKLSDKYDQQYLIIQGNTTFL